MYYELLNNDGKEQVDKLCKPFFQGLKKIQNDENRSWILEAVIEKLRDNICLHCGTDNPWCKCWDDS